MQYDVDLAPLENVEFAADSLQVFHSVGTAIRLAERVVANQTQRGLGADIELGSLHAGVCPPPPGYDLWDPAEENCVDGELRVNGLCCPN